MLEFNICEMCLMNEKYISHEFKLDNLKCIEDLAKERKLV